MDISKRINPVRNPIPIDIGIISNGVNRIYKFCLDNPIIIILSSFFVLVPILRCRLFFDSYAIKYWIVQAGIALIFILYCYRPKQMRFDRTVGYLLLLYLGINFISWQILPPPYKYVALPGLIALVFYISICFFTSQYLIIPDRVIVLWIISTVGVALLGIYHYYNGHRVVSTLGNENFLASHLALTFFVAVGYFWRYLRNGTSVIKQAFLVGIGIAVLLIFGTVLYFARSRGAWLGLSVGLVSFVIIAFVRPGRRLLVSVLILLIVLGLACIPKSIDFISKQFHGDVRPAIWESSIYMCAMKPWLGWGKGAYFIFYPQFRITDYWLTRSPTDLTVHAHNEFLQICSETGVIGLIIFLVLITAILRIGIQKINEWEGYPLRGLQKAYEKRYLMTGMISGVICLLTHNLVSNNLQMHSSAIFLWLTLGLILGMDQHTVKFRQSRFDIWRKKLKQNVRRLILLALTGIMAIIMWLVCIKPMISQYMFKQGWNFRLKDNWNLAVKEYKKALIFDPWNVELHYRMAYAYVQSGQFDKAIEKYEDVCRLAPDYGNVHRNMGIVYIHKGDRKLAARHLIKSRQINPYDTITLHNLTLLKELADE